MEAHMHDNVYTLRPHTPETRPNLVVSVDTSSTQLAYGLITENIEVIADKFWRAPNQDTSLMGPVDDENIITKNISKLRRTIPTQLTTEQGIVYFDVPTDQKKWLQKKPDEIRVNGNKMSEREVKTSHQTMTRVEVWNEPGARSILKEFMAQHGDLLFFAAYTIEEVKPKYVDPRYLAVARESIRLFLFGAGGKRIWDGLKHSINEIEKAEIKSAKLRHPTAKEL